jgi:hypothetical protein
MTRMPLSPARYSAAIGDVANVRLPKSAQKYLFAEWARLAGYTLFVVTRR